MSKIRTRKADNLLKSIKDKESELFKLIAQYHLAFVGNDNPTPREKVKEIAERLKISISTAKTHRDIILQKFFCKNITEASNIARKYQIL